jgi:menaquinone-dependent protoporphyrinogen oxidase
MGEARRFAGRHAETLASHPTWLFSSGPIGEPLKPEAGSAVKLDDVIAATGARGHRLFPGRLDRGRLGFGERTVVRTAGAERTDRLNPATHGHKHDALPGIPDRRRAFR